MNFIDKPEKRGRLRSTLGKEYFIMKRKIFWLKNRYKYTSLFDEIPQMYSLIKHQSMLLRPLKDIDMHLQYNKIKKLRISYKKYKWCSNKTIANFLGLEIS